MKGKLFIFLGVVLVGAALLSFRVLDRVNHVGKSPAEFGVVKTGAPAKVPPNKETQQLAQGTELMYRFVYTGHVGDDAASSSLTGAQRLLGELHIAIVDSMDEAYKVFVWIQPDNPSDPVSVSTHKALGSLTREGIEAQLSTKGFELRLIETDGLSEQKRVFWQSLFDRMTSALEMPKVSSKIVNQAPFSRAETMGGVPIMATYVWECSPNCVRNDIPLGSIRRTISPRGVGDRTLEGEALIVLRENSQGVLSVRTKTIEHMKTTGSELIIHSELQVTFVSQHRGVPKQWQASLKELGVRNREASDPVKEQQNDEIEIDKAYIQGIDESDLLAELRQHQDLETLPQASYLRLKSWIAVHTDSISSLTAAFTEQDVSETVRFAYIKALGANGHEKAQEALIQMAGSYGDHVETIDRVLTALALVKEPTKAAIHTVLSLTGKAPGPSASKAQLVLGAMGHHLRQSSKNEVKNQALVLEKTMAGWLQEAKDPLAQASFLSAIGNLGPTDLAILEPFINTSDPQVRAQAFFAIRFSPSGEADQKLLTGISSQESPIVRRDAVEALTMRPKGESWLKAVSSLPFDVLDGNERLLLARSVSSAHNLDRSTRADILKKISQGTTNSQVVGVVSDYLNQL